MERCDVCGSELINGHPVGDGCQFCLPCSGVYAPGTEECDWCVHLDGCEKEFLERFGC